MARHVFLTGPPGDPGPARLGGEGARPDPPSGSPSLAALAAWLGALQPGGREGREDGGAPVSGSQRPAATMVLSHGGRGVLCRFRRPLSSQRLWRGAEDGGRGRASLAQHALRLKSGCSWLPSILLWCSPGAIAISVFISDLVNTGLTCSPPPPRAS